jgi:WD40 repeat protein
VAWRVWRLEDADDARAMFKPGGKSFVVASHNRLHLFDLELDRESSPYPAQGRYFASDVEDTPTLTDRKNDLASPAWPGQDDRPAQNVAACGDGQIADSAGDWVACATGLRIVVETRGIEMELLGHMRPVAAIRFSQDGKLLGSVSDRHVRVWRLPTNVLGSFVKNEVARELRLSPDGKTLAVWREGNGLLLLDIASGRLRGNCAGTTGVRRMVWSADSRKLAVATGKGVEVLDAATCTGPARELDAVDVAWDARGRLASAGAVGNIVLWQPSGERAADFRGHHAVAFAPDGRRLATGGDDLDVHVLDLEGAPEKLLRWHTQPIDRLAFAPRGDALASSAGDGLVLWNATGRAEPLAHARARDFEFSPDGRVLAAAFDGAISLFDVATAHAETLAGWAGRADAVHFSPDGTRVAAACDDGGIRVWEVDTRNLVAIFRQKGPARDFAFLPTGAALIGAGQDGLRRFALADAQIAPQDPAALAGWIDQYSSASLGVLAPDSPIEPEDTH